MLAVDQSNPSTPLSAPPRPSARARRDQVEADTLLIQSEAVGHGWAERKPAYTTRRRLSRYLKLAHPERGRVTVRISDHLPTCPAGGGQSLLLHVVGVPGSLGSALAWLREGGAA